MKDKLIAKLKQNILDLRESSSTFIVELNDGNKNEIISDLVIPFMQLTNSETVEDLSANLELLVNGDFESPEHKTLLDKVADVLLEGSSEAEDEINHLITNAYAVVNKFAELKGEKTTVDNKESSAFDQFDQEIISFMNSLEGGDTSNDSIDTGTAEEKKEAVGDTTDAGTAEDEALPDDAEVGETDGIEIVAAGDKVDETPWAEVNQVEQKNYLKNAFDTTVAGAQEAIDEMYGLVASYDKTSDQKQPHHVIMENDLVLNLNGLKTAALFLLKPNSSKNLTSEQKATIAKHLLRHYQESSTESPAKLMKLAEGKESVIVINIKDDEMKEFGELFKIETEEVATYVGLMEALLTDLVNSGVINIESDDKNFDESVVSVRLNKDQTEELIKYFDIMSTDITKILNSDFAALSYKVTNSDLEKSLAESEKLIQAMEANVNTLSESVKVRDSKLEELTKQNKNHSLDKTKFEAIINFIKTIDGVEDTLIQFVTNVVEAEDTKQVNYLLKLGSTFMKSERQRPTFKKVSMINHATSRDFNTLNDLLDIETNNEATSLIKEVDKNVNDLADMFD